MLKELLVHSQKNNLMSQFRKVLMGCLILLLIGSCASKEDLVYFQGVDTVEVDSVRMDYTPVFKLDDQLAIVVSSIDSEASLPFNLPTVSYNVKGGVASGTPQIQTYLIAKDGTIEFPQLGKIRLAGLTRIEAIELFKEKLSPFLLNPTINIQIVNFEITVLGEVKRPGKFSVKNERITIVEALGLAGDLSLWGKRDNILVIRETEEGKKYERIDLTSSNVFESPVYYLEQNDVVYVEPNKPKINNSATSATTGIIISVTSLLITVISLIVR